MIIVARTELIMSVLVSASMRVCKRECVCKRESERERVYVREGMKLMNSKHPLRSHRVEAVEHFHV